MTGYRSSFFRHDCSKRGCYVDQLPSWNDLIEAFPRGIRPTDVDGMVEINGHVLFMEEKSEGKSLEPGQKYALDALASRPGITVLCMRPHLDGMEVLILGMGEPKGWQHVTRQQLIDWLRWWATRADRNDTAA